MPSRLLAAAAALPLLLAGCREREIEVRPFALRVATAAGDPIRPSDPLDPVVSTTGVATVVAPGELRVEDLARGPVSVTFDAGASPGLAFPPDLDGAVVTVTALYDPAAVAPGGVPIPYPALRLATGVPPDEHFRFLLGDSPYTGDDGLPLVPRPLGPETGVEDIPYFAVLADYVYFEPAECGLAYYDLLEAQGFLDGVVSRDRLRRREETSSVVYDPADPWTVRHVESWHRVGDCPGRPKSWTQFAAWR